MLTFCVGFMAIIATVFVYTAVVEPTTETVVTAAIFGPFAVIGWIGTFRVARRGVFARPEGIVVRTHVRTTRIPWDEVRSIGMGAVSGGAAGAAGASAPVVVRQRPGRPEPEELELDLLGGYRPGGEGRTLAERAAKGLNEVWDQWRKQSV